MKDDECSPKRRDSTRRRCTAGSKRHVGQRACIRRHPQGCRPATPRPARRCAYKRGAVHVGAKLENSCPGSCPCVGRVGKGARHAAAATAPRPSRAHATPPRAGCPSDPYLLTYTLTGVRHHPPGRTDKNLCRCFGAPACRVFPDHLIIPCALYLPFLVVRLLPDLIRCHCNRQ